VFNQSSGSTRNTNVAGTTNTSLQNTISKESPTNNGVPVVPYRGQGTYILDSNFAA